MKVEVFRDGQREHRWRFVSDNGTVLARASKGYKRIPEMVAVIEEILGGTWDRTDATDNTPAHVVNAVRSIPVVKESGER